MSALPSPPTKPLDPENRIVLHGISWDAYEQMRELVGPSTRLTYLDGELEIMTTSTAHERLKKMLARLLEAWAVERKVRLEGYGNSTFKKKLMKRGLEPDECYCIDKLVDVPQLAIEVVISHPLVNKLDVYAGLKVPEVWQFQDGYLTVLHLVGRSYKRREKSKLLPSLDIRQLESFAVLDQPQTDVVLVYLDAVRES